MSSAPARPRQSRQKPKTDTDDDASKAFRITLAGRSLELRLRDLGPGDDLVARQQTGLPVAPFFGLNGNEAFGADSLLILWWMARRKAGEPNLRFEQVLAAYPTHAEIQAANPDLEIITDDDPEA